MQAGNIQRSMFNAQCPMRSSAPAPARDRAHNRCDVSSDDAEAPSVFARIRMAMPCGDTPGHPERSEGSRTGCLHYTSCHSLIHHPADDPLSFFGMTMRCASAHEQS